MRPGLLLSLALHDRKARYAGTALGGLWALAGPVLAHRIILSFGSGGPDRTAALIEQILASVPVPTEDFAG